jgi:uncharacterized damage-inducible protein DinB
MEVRVVYGAGETKYAARMKNFIRLTTIATLLSLSLPAAAQAGVMGDLLKDVGDLEKKVMALANAIPESAYDWTPGPGVRSTAEVLKHIAADNYFMPVLLDKPAPKETGITKDYKTTLAFEKRPMNRAAVVVELEKSFAFLRSSMNSTSDAELSVPIDVFGQKSTARGLWISTATHLHEHLGQLIVYARANKVTPPWSK